MWKEYGGIGFLLLVSLLLAACGTSLQAGDQPVQSESIDSQSQLPPALQLEIGDDTIRTVRGGYSWSYYDTVEGMMAGIEAEANSPHEIVNIEKGRQVDRNAEVELIFGETPLSYRIFMWDKDGNQKPISTKLNLADHEGKHIFEIRAHWEQGDSSYVVALDVKQKEEAP